MTEQQDTFYAIVEELRAINKNLLAITETLKDLSLTVENHG